MNELETLKTKKVLYVEDDTLTVEFTKRLIQKDVKEIFVANNGKEGLQMYQDEKPDIIITDIEMPVMNGIDMIKEVRKKSSTKPIIILTAYEDESYHAGNMANIVLLKPINKNHLKEALLRCLETEVQF